MPTQKRTRTASRGRDPRAAALARKRQEDKRRRLVIVVFTAVVLVLGVSVIVSAGGGTPSADSTSTTTTTAATRTTVSLVPAPSGMELTGDTPCPKPDGTSPRVTKFAKPPPLSCITPSKNYVAEVMTTKGMFTIELDAKAAPNTVANFVGLARYHFYEGIAFHHIIPGFLVQGGDPTATGIGGPGYRFDDELPRGATYRIGTVAMANSGPNTNGSQFFVVTGEAGASLPLRYTPFGTVTAGMDVIRAIEKAGTPPPPSDPQGGGEPTEVIKITSVTIKES